MHLAQPHHLRPFKINDDGLTQDPGPAGSREVTMKRTKVPVTKDEILASVIHGSTIQLDVNKYFDFMGIHLHEGPPHAPDDARARADREVPADSTDPFPLGGNDAYRVLSLATELFVLSNCGVIRGKPLELNTADEEARFGHRLPARCTRPVGGLPGAARQRRSRAELDILPYLDLIRRKLGDIGAVRSSAASLIDQQAEPDPGQAAPPDPMLELIWSLLDGGGDAGRRRSTHRAPLPEPAHAGGTIRWRRWRSIRCGR